MGRPAGTSRRIPYGIGLLLSLAATPVCAGPPTLRVLLMESSGPVEVAGRLLAPSLGGLSVAGRPVGEVWRTEGGGPLPVGPLRVRGAVEVRRTDAGLRVVNQVDLEDYVAATLGRELYADWSVETQKAQAVLARTFALHRRAAARQAFDVRSGDLDQVYGGVDAETGVARAATAATQGEVLLFDGKPILAAYHSSSGGRTASAEEVWGRALPYLQSVVVENEEDSPDTYWRVSFTGTTLGRALAPLGLQLGTVTDLRVEGRTPSGRALRVAIRGTAGRSSVEARALRDALGRGRVRSTLFEIRASGDTFTFVGSGHGHGVGMSQWGAEAMARRGADYRQILATFYPGTTLVRLAEH